MQSTELPHENATKTRQGWYHLKAYLLDCLHVEKSLLQDTRNCGNFKTKSGPHRDHDGKRNLTPFIAMQTDASFEHPCAQCVHQLLTAENIKVSGTVCSNHQVNKKAFLVLIQHVRRNGPNVGEGDQRRDYIIV